MESQTFQASVKAGPTGVSPVPCVLATTSNKTAPCHFIAGLIRPATESFFLSTLEFHMTLLLHALSLYLDFKYFRILEKNATFFSP